MTILNAADVFLSVKNCPFTVPSAYPAQCGFSIAMLLMNDEIPLIDRIIDMAKMRVSHLLLSSLSKTRTSAGSNKITNADVWNKSAARKKQTIPLYCLFVNAEKAKILNEIAINCRNKFNELK